VDIQNGPWKIGIVKTGIVAIKTLVTNDKNWRIHKKSQEDALEGAIETVGVIKSLLINLRTSEEWPQGERDIPTIIDGHLRVAMAIRAEQEALPAEYCDLSPRDEAIVLATLDPLSALAFAHKDKLDFLLREMPDAMDVRLQEMLANLAKQEGLYRGENIKSPTHDDNIGTANGNNQNMIFCPKCGFEFNANTF